MHAITRRTLAGLAVVAAPALAAAQTTSSVFGAPLSTVTSGYAGLPSTGSATHQLLASHDCPALGVGVCSPTNNIQQGDGTWNYAPFNSQANLPGGAAGGNVTGSVATLSFTTAQLPFAFNFALLFDDTQLALDDGFNPAFNQDFATLRLFANDVSTTDPALALLFQITSPTAVTVSYIGGMIPAPVGPIASLDLFATGAGNDGVFKKRTDWQAFPTGLFSAVPGSYTLEFATVDQGAKDYVTGLALDVARAPQNVVPEPSTYALLGAGLAGVLGAARRRRSA